jgi:hypothetical protein
MGGETFEQMAQALLEKNRRGFGNLIQFGVGPDGSREATWNQPPEHPEYIPSPSATDKMSAKWVFQVKFHDIGQRGWRGAGDAVISDLKTELDKLINKHAVTCDHYVLITNVPLSGARWIGTRDQVNKISEEWRSNIPWIEVWDAVDLSRMLDNNCDVRTAYQELILPGDSLSAIYRQVQFQADRREHTLRGYLYYVVDNESKARADEAGDDDQLPLAKVFVDQTFKLDRDKIPECYNDLIGAWSSTPFLEQPENHLLPIDLDFVPASFVLLIGAIDKVMLLAGPGYGKSTITQFLALYHACRLVRPCNAERLAERLKLPNGISPSTIDSHCKMRFPFRIELRRYAKWRKSQSGENDRVGIASYIARELIGKNVESNLNENDIFELANKNPILLILDGLDEVPNKESRDDILKDCDAFLYRCSGENADLQIVMSSRPQGYNGEFDRFEPIRWRINDLSQSDFKTYCNSWLSERIKSAEERAEAEERIKRGMTSDAVRNLATTLLQATVMLTIVRRKSDIPEERHRLFEKYVDVVFQREKAKNELVSRYDSELRRLHELVGYRLHEAIGRGDDDRIPETRFKEFVREVWHLNRGDKYFEGVINEEYENIVQLATDRLVFLSGKGEKQTDIDFVVQPYREFFAAQYLNFHTQASPDKVFECLVERGPFWQNVLQFYVALAAPAQQIAWVQRASDEARKMDTFSGLIKSVEYQRATLITLPEYGRLSLTQLVRSMKVALPQQTWWMWIGQDWAIPIVRGLKSGEACTELLKELRDFGLTNNDNAQFALWLFPRAITRPSDRASFTEVLQELIAIPSYTKTALVAALLHDFPVNLKDVDEAVISSIFTEYPYQRELRGFIKQTNLVARISRGALLRLLCSESPFMNSEFGTTIWRFLNIPLDKRKAEEFVLLEEMDLIVEAPLWVRTILSPQGSLNFIGDYTANTHVVEQYAFAIYDALQNPCDPQKHQNARDIEQKLPKDTDWHLCVDALLGPSPTEFPSVDNWRHYKLELSKFFENCDGLNEVRSTCVSICETSRDPEFVWSIFLFHPTHWECLVEFGLLSRSSLNRINALKWANIVRLSSKYLEAFIYSSRHYAIGDTFNPNPFLDPEPFVRVALAVHQRGGLVDSSFLPTIFRLVDFSRIPGSVLRQMLTGIQNHELIPDYWAQFLMDVCIQVLSDEPHFVSQFRAALSRSTPNRRWLMSHWMGFDSKLVQKWIGNLLTLGDEDSLELAVELALSCRESSEDEYPELNEKVATALINPKKQPAQIEGLLLGLVNSRPSMAEALLYKDVNWFSSLGLCDFPYRFRIAERIQRLPQAMPRSSYSALSESLRSMVDRSKGYPVEVSTAALNALIQIDIANKEPIKDELWQISDEAADARW